jgi:hypothetical protein
MTNETLRMQMLAGVITEGEYKTKLQENEMAAVGEKVEAAVEDKLEATVDNLSDEQKSQLRAELAKAGITANSKIEDVVSKLDESLNEVEGDTKTKVANALSNVGGALMKSMLVPLIPLVVGKITGTGFGGGVAITAGTAGALIALAKLLGAEETQDSLNEHYVAGGIVGIGAINQIPPREKAVYEDAFEHFLGQKYGINEEMENESINTIEDLEPYLKSMFPNSEITLSYDEEGDGIFIDGVYVSEGAYQKWDTYIESTEKEKSFQSTEELIDYLKGNLMEEGKEVEEGNLGHNEIYSIEPEGRFWVVTWSTMDGKKEKVFQSEDEAREFASTLDEGKKPGTFKERSAMAKKARAGKDIGEKGKNFEKIAKSAAKKYGSEEAGKKVAGAVMYGKLNK